jgi:uncharacterized protein YbbC (DUF1343 family)
MEVGLDRLAEPAARALLRGRLGVLSHAASVDRRLRHLLDLLAEVGVKPAILFGPEHGFAAAAQDMIGVGDAVDARSGARVVSLYGDRLEDLSPRPEHLAAIDLLLVDLADVGSRYYTFVWTALLAVRACAAAGVPVVLLDRPNPIGGVAFEGCTQQPGFTSFVGWERVPVRHALTLGEMVALFAARDGLRPSIVAVRGWDRATLASGWDRPFVLPSPNMPTADTALVYPGGCLLEGTNLSEGRGTTRPFEIVGAPWLDPDRLAGELAASGLPGFVARPLVFQPTFQKHAGLPCGGVQIHVTDATSFRPLATYVALVAFARRQDPERFRFRTERYEFVDDIPAFDLLTGSAGARLAIEAGDDPVAIAEAVSRPDPEWPAAIAEAMAAAARFSI